MIAIRFRSRSAFRPAKYGRSATRQAQIFDFLHQWRNRLQKRSGFERIPVDEFMDTDFFFAQGRQMPC